MCILWKNNAQDNVTFKVQSLIDEGNFSTHEGSNNEGLAQLILDSYFYRQSSAYTLKHNFRI